MKEKVLLNATVCLLVKDDQVLLALKTKKIGSGCWNGYGGGIEKGETPVQSAIRELNEESRIITLPRHLEKVAIIFFHNKKSDGEIFVCKVHFFIIKKWTGEAKDTETMINPTFFNKNSLPFEKMMPADRIYFPLILNEKKIIAKVKYGPYQKELIDEIDIQEVSAFPKD